MWAFSGRLEDPVDDHRVRVQACAGLVWSGVFGVAGVGVFGSGWDLMNKPP